MGFLQSLGNAVKENVRSGLINKFLDATGQSSSKGSSEYIYDSNGRIVGINSSYATEKFKNHNAYDESNYDSEKCDYQYFEGNRDGGLYESTIARPKYMKLKNIDQDIYKKYDKSKGKIQHIIDSLEDISNQYINKYDNNEDSLTLKLPNWGYGDFINERNIWQKQIGNIFDEPGWFYFKIFFDFDSYHGLFGSLLNTKTYYESTNTAIKYLNYCNSSYNVENIKDRMTALYKFASILSYINTEAPWYFKEIHNIDKLSTPLFEDINKDKFIEITTLPDAIDMRLSTLMSLYQYACYDNINHKEIIPENLRKFNMSIVIFQSPLRYLHTSYTSNKKSELFGGLFSKNINSSAATKYKNLYNQNDMMSFRIYTLYNCEFDIESFSKVMPSSMSNETPFNLGKNNIIIKYDSVTEHTMNEFYEMLYGTNGFYFNQYANFQIATSESTKEGDGILVKNSLNKMYKKTLDDYHNNQLDRYKALSDTFGDLAQGGTNLFGISLSNSYNKAVDASEAIMHGMFVENNVLKDVGTNFVLGLLGSSKTSDTSQGNIYGDYGINSAFFKQKLDMLKNGVHINTKQPYTYDPTKTVEYENSKRKNYSAVDYDNLKRNVQSFNLGSWLKTGGTNLGSDLNFF